MRRSTKSLSGKSFGRLKVVCASELRKGYLACICKCGASTEVREHSLKRRTTRSCGCLQVEAVTKHGHLKGGKESPEYRAWSDAKARCFNPRHQHYSRYGGRGIVMCKRWRKSFAAFYKSMGPRPSGMSFERKNVNGNYTPKNCCWAPHSVQVRNRRTSVWLEHNGHRRVLTDWAREFGVPIHRLYWLVRKKGLTLVEAIPLLNLDSSERKPVQSVCGPQQSRKIASPKVTF